MRRNLKQRNTFSQILSITEYKIKCNLSIRNIVLIYFFSIELYEKMYIERKIIYTGKEINIKVSIITNISVLMIQFYCPTTYGAECIQRRCTFLPGTNQVLVINQLSLSFPDILPSISGVQSGNRSPPIVDCLVRETNRQIATIKSTDGSN